MFARSSHRRSRKRSAPRAPGIPWWVYLLVVLIAVGAAALVIAALLEY
ncbi:hypothetical protein BWL13_02430 [Microbacterium oleivorans]|uniref:Uncharacterized protein n=1 Tax=Microbacterium oleivorans TaxID=273677 RepID=A0A031FW24_9MICO|nr:hypothetical protein [Microbacterium oleivorans]AZS44833.1 hypothetical protein BWL13_02430 [Microbacterium oleivorans]EZP29054.1 hypothetical protein BW34_00903 [Microbacterium oleivorans]